MAGVRKDGILQTTGGGAGTAVDIVTPIGQDLMANSVSVAIASDQSPLPVSLTPLANTSVTQTLNVLNEEITINVPDGYNSVTAIFDLVAFNGSLVFLQGSVATGFTSSIYGYRLDLNTWINILTSGGSTSRLVMSFPIISGEPFSIVAGIYNSGSVDVELIASTSMPYSVAPLTNTELRASPVIVSLTEFPAASVLTDNFANPTTTTVAAMNMLWDGVNWDRMPGNQTDGALVNLGANNDVTIPTGVPFAPSIPLADNTINPSPQIVGAFPMLWDGLFWDRQPGNSTDGTLVNLGINNDVDTELPAAVALSDILANPTAPAVGAYELLWTGAAWVRKPGAVAYGSLNRIMTQTGVDVFSVGPMVDNAANPSVAQMSTFGMLFDGVLWDRMPGNSTDGALVNLGANNDVTVTGSLTSITNPISTKTDLTPSAPTVASVGVASAAAVAAAATRKGLILRNLSNARISLGFGSPAVLDSGVTLYPRDTFDMREYDFDLSAVNAIASAAASPLAVQEYLT